MNVPQALWKSRASENRRIVKGTGRIDYSKLFTMQELSDSQKINEPLEPISKQWNAEQLTGRGKWSLERVILLNH